MSSPRDVQPEWLDQLPAHDPRVAQSRRDLGRLNGLMLQVGIMARVLTRHHTGPPPRTLLDLGGGDGIFALRLARRLAPRWPGVTVTLVDRHDVVTDTTRAEFARHGWNIRTIAADVFSYLEQEPPDSHDIAAANLFLHHFAPETLGALLRRVARLVPCFVACEPRRGSFALNASRLVGLVGCSAVTRHDAVVSVRAGFTGRELSAAWPPGSWRLREHAAGLFTHCFAAVRSASGAAVDL
jgi:hypothetical protein